MGFWGVGFFCYSSLHAEVVNLNTGWRIDVGRGKQRRKRDGSRERNFSLCLLSSFTFQKGGHIPELSLIPGVPEAEQVTEGEETALNTD